jgi:hypothetical protein
MTETKYDEKGMRFLLTFGCSKKCPFCYQLELTDDRRVLPLVDFERILAEKGKDNYDYITLFGGEVMEIPDFADYVRAARKNFVGRINITTNGDADLGDYINVVDAGVDHINFSVNGRLDIQMIYKTAWLAARVSTRFNIFLPAEFDEERMKNVIIPWMGVARQQGMQVSLMYDYDTKIEDYDATVEKITGIVENIDPGQIEMIHKGANYLIFRRGLHFDFWVDINYRKNQETIVTPTGKVTRGFQYMLENER